LIIQFNYIHFHAIGCQLSLGIGDLYFVYAIQWLDVPHAWILRALGSCASVLHDSDRFGSYGAAVWRQR
jgi:hypothetical protein